MPETSRSHGCQKVVLTAWLLGSLSVCAAPLVAGVVAVEVMPGFGGLRPGAPWPLVPVFLAIVLAASLILGPIVETLVRRLLDGAPQGVATVADEAAGLVLLTMLLAPIMADWSSAAVAALVGVLGFVLTSPIVEWMARRRGDG